MCGETNPNHLAFLQGHPTQTVFFETALKDSNMQVRFDLMSVLECQDHEFLAYGTNLYFMLTQRPLLDQMLDRPGIHCFALKFNNLFFNFFWKNHSW